MSSPSLHGRLFAGSCCLAGRRLGQLVQPWPQAICGTAYSTGAEGRYARGTAHAVAHGPVERALAITAYLYAVVTLPLVINNKTHFPYNHNKTKYIAPLDRTVCFHYRVDRRGTKSAALSERPRTEVSRGAHVKEGKSPRAPAPAPTTQTESPLPSIAAYPRPVPRLSPTESPASPH